MGNWTVKGSVTVVCWVIFSNFSCGSEIYV